ncbi:MAG TPA: ATP-binding cassette domain-containing protein [Mucilaginibacter sp.]|jgi:molybdate transport system ATP-binding protein|nr:ATP-binding cassette domain-containing protein [Mucilaginibacter sp.]
MIRIAIETKLKAYSGQQELRIVREFHAGSITKIFGPSGSGKTTLLKIIAGFVEPEKGSIVVDDITWLDTNSKIFVAPQKRKAGFVFQDYALFPNMTVHQHMAYATSDEAWISKLLKIGKLDAFITHKPGYLSGGQQQRLAIFRALATKPKLLLMDEPFSALDPKMRSELIGDLKDLFAELGTTVLIVSHYPQELEGLTEHELNLH